MKYLRLRDHLLEVVDGLAPGDPLPPERTLAATLGASRMTVRKAVDELVTIGHVVRRPGVGTFVAAKHSQGLAVTSFSEDMRARGIAPGARTLAADTVAAGPSLSRRLEVSPAVPVLRVRRLRLADGSPMAIEHLHVPADLVPGLTGEDLTGASFYALLRERYGVRLAGGEQVLEATVTDEEESGHLGVPLHSPAFLFERTTRSAEGRAVEFVRSVYRGDRYRIVSPITAPRRGA
ncbi:GntR family transcriptional regulator [Ornithinicoccus halotolerans]|uniref:GntR family transcriptional regulator n=1 Tax=Ornithinicoccus halotolerans TaxID=1748220 RepID=UPI0012956764|nr:GntR family transcriptional regulator [Ornithinicoccus halotolerans]